MSDTKMGYWRIPLMRWVGDMRYSTIIKVILIGNITVLAIQHFLGYKFDEFLAFLTILLATRIPPIKID